MIYIRYYWVLLLLGIGGTIFSGYLSYYTLWGPGCQEAVVSCGSKPIELFGLPTCVYGFGMYVTVGVLALFGLRNKTRGWMAGILWLAVVGVLFSGSLSFYELVTLRTPISDLPACVYGFLIYTAILIIATLGIRRKTTVELTHKDDGMA